MIFVRLPLPLPTEEHLKWLLFLLHTERLSFKLLPNLSSIWNTDLIVLAGKTLTTPHTWRLSPFFPNRVRLDIELKAPLHTRSALACITSSLFTYTQLEKTWCKLSLIQANLTITRRELIHIHVLLRLISFLFNSKKYTEVEHLNRYCSL